MYLYIIFGLLSISSIFEVFGKKNHLTNQLCNNIFYFFIFILFCLASLRWERGTDWTSYLNYFMTETSQLNLTHHFENGFIILNFAVKQISNDYTVFIIIESIILYFFLTKAIKSIAVYPIFSLLCFFSIMKGGIFFVRQTIAVSILLLSVKYIINRKFLKFFICVFIAASIHRSSWLFLPTYYISVLKIDKPQYIIILLVSIIISFILLKILNGASLSVGNIYIDAKLNGYLRSGFEGEMYGVNMSKETMLIRGFGKRLIILLLIVLFLRKRILTDRTTSIIFNIYFTGICLYLILAPISTDFARAVLAFDLMDIFLLPLIVKYINIPSNRKIIFFLIILLSANRLHSSIDLRPELFIPYKSIFNKTLKVELY